MKRGENLYKHGMSATSEHCIWRSMLNRCTNQKHRDWHTYGGKGITVCEQWKVFANFYADMGPRPSPKHSIDRIDPSGNYEPGNCRWATAKEQARHFSRNRMLTHEGVTRPLVEWAEITGLKRKTISDRLDTGWTVEAALTTPPVRKRARNEEGRYVQAVGA